MKHSLFLQLGNDMITSVGRYLEVSEGLGLDDKSVSPLARQINWAGN